MALLPSEFDDINVAEELVRTQTGMGGKVYAVREGNVVTLYIQNMFNPSASDPGGSTVYTQIATLPDKYMPKFVSVYISAISINGEPTRYYIANNKLYILKSALTSITLYDIITYVGKDM